MGGRDGSLDDVAWLRGQAELAGALIESVSTREKLESGGADQRIAILNALQFAILFNFDLRQLLRDIAVSRRSWAAKLYARVLALTLYECTEDFMAILGKDFRNALTELGTPEHVRLLNELHRRVCMFFDEHRAELQAIRGEVIGHRQHDASVQIAQLRRISVDRIRDLGYELLAWLNDFHSFSGSVLRHMTAQQRRPPQG
jgi:transcriptional regulator with XRE-family HTH domain